MQVVFVLVSVFGAIYFSLRARVDYFSLAYFSAIIYFLPGFFGRASYHIGGEWRELDIIPEVYAIMTVVVFSVILASFLIGRRNGVAPAKFSYSRVSKFLLIVSLLSLFGLSATFIEAGAAIFHPDKNVVMEAIGRWHILYSYSAVIGLPVAYLAKHRFFFVFFFCLLVFNVYIGFRSSLAIAVLSVFLLYFSSFPEKRPLLARWRMVFLVVLFGVFLFSIKHVLWAVKAGDMTAVLSAIGQPDFYWRAITKSEPFIIQSTLNEVVLRGFRTEFDHVSAVVYQLLFFSDKLGLTASSFNDYFQGALFPGVDYGMASNIWAQMWSAGGWPLLIFFVLFFNMVIAAFNRTLVCGNVFVRAGFAPMASYWAFYIHRNDLAYMVNIEKRLFVLWLVAFLGVAFIFSFARSAQGFGADGVRRR